MKPIEDEILALGRSIVDIELRRYAAALEALICDDYVGVDPSGAIIDKAISVGRYRDPEFERRYRYTHAWLRTGVGWKVRASQLTPMLKSADLIPRSRRRPPATSPRKLCG